MWRSTTLSGGRTRIGKALELVHSKVLVSARSGIPKIMIVLNDGRQTKDPDAKDLKEASEPLRRAGVRVLARQTAMSYV